MKEIWCTLHLIISFCPEFLNLRTESALSWFQDFEKKGCVYWIFFLTFWSLEGVSLISNCLFLIWCIEIGGIELLGVDKTNNKGVIWFIQGLGLRGKTTKATDRLGTPSYCFIFSFNNGIWMIMRLHARSGYLRRFILKYLGENQIWEIVTNLRKRFTILDLGQKVCRHLKCREFSRLFCGRKVFTIRLNRIECF